MDALTNEWLRQRKAFGRYLKLERDMASNTVESYLRDVAHLSEYAIAHAVVPTAVNRPFLETLLCEMSATGVAATTQSRMISGWRSFFKMLVLEEAIDDNPATLLLMPARGKHLPDVLTDADVTAMQEALDRSLPDEARDYVIIEVLYGCGLRVSELVNLKINDIYFDEECLQIFGKGSKMRWVPINRHALQLLDNYIHELRCHVKPRAGEENYVFLGRRGSRLTRVRVFQIVKRQVERAGINKHVSPHSLRHTFATELVEHGADLRAVQEMLGHASITTTEIYTHISRSMLRETINSYHPHYRRS